MKKKGKNIKRNTLKGIQSPSDIRPDTSFHSKASVVEFDSIHISTYYQMKIYDESLKKSITWD